MRFAKSLFALAIILRPTADDAAHRVAAQNPAFDAVVAIECAGRHGGTGTVIAARWVLTAAHVVSACQRESLSVIVRGARMRSDTALTHPLYRRGAHGLDVAMIRLTSDAGVPPISLAATPLAVGDTVTLVGFGVGGPEASASGVKRLGTNVIDLVGMNERGSAIPEWEAAIDFDDGAVPAVNATGSGDPLPLEGISSGGDSGGPFLRRIGGTWQVGAVYHTTRYVLGNVGAKPPRFGGSVAYAARVTFARDWIDSTLTGTR